MEKKRELFSGLEFPTTTHQRVVGWLFTEMAVYLRGRKADCHLIAAPFAVYLGEDGDGFLTPDITIVGRGGELDDAGCHGTPDWVAEVVSPHSQTADYGRKLAAYINAGVREYWIVDPKRQMIVAYYLDHPDAPFICRFGENVKSDIYEGLEIDTSPLLEIRYDEKGMPGHLTDGHGKEGASEEGRRSERAWDGVRQAACQGGPIGDSAKDESDSGRPDREEVRKMSVDEVKTYMQSHFADLVAAGNKGPVIKAAMGALKGKAEGKTLHEAATKLCGA